MIYFVLPVYNEEKNIRQLILKLKDLMSGQHYKIIVVNDGSSDGSLDVLNKLSDESLIVENYSINMNIGTVFSTGINRVLSESKNNDDVMVIMESDQTSEIDLIKGLVAEINDKKRDVAIASRYIKGGGYVNFPLPRTLFSRSANRLMHFYFPILGVRDYTIFFRAYRVGILKKAVDYFGKFGLIQSKGFVANAELLIKLSLLTDRISEIPFVYNYEKKIGKSKIGIIRTVNEYFVLVAYLKRIFKKVKRWEKLHNTGKP